MTDIHDHVNELTSGRTHRQPYTHGTETRYHRTYVPALIDQLDSDCARPTNEQGFAGYQSAAPLWLEPQDTVAWIDEQAANWLWRLAKTENLGDTKLSIRRLHGLWASQDVETKRRIEKDVRAWWTTARVVSGWDSVAWKPDNTCPLCGERRSLRIKLADQIGFCTGCRECWTAETIGLLADHIRAESEGTDDDGEAA